MASRRTLQPKNQGEMARNRISSGRMRSNRQAGEIKYVVSHRSHDTDKASRAVACGLEDETKVRTLVLKGVVIRLA